MKLGGRNKPYADNIKLRLKKVIKEMGDPRAEQINARFMAMYRSERLGAGVKISTIQRDEAELAGMFTMLIQSGEFHSKKSCSFCSRYETKDFRNDISDT